MPCRVGLLICAGLLSISTRLLAQDASSDPPAHVSVVDGAAVLERDGRADSSPSNMPLLAGDRVRTDAGRVEILFADGSTLHLDASTTVDFQSDELVRLLEGRIRLSIPGPARAVSYRVDAPSATVTIDEPGEYRIAVLHGDRDTEVELAVIRGSAELVNDEGRTPLRAGQRAYSRANAAPSYAYVFNSASWDAFDRWSEARRDERLGVSAEYLPDPVRSYAASFDRYGAWQYDASYGQVWYPRVAAGWRPYSNGRWVTLRPYGWTWVGADLWDWPTHHYGRWGISAGVWFWIPGRSWAPAWVSWAYAPGYVSWCPLGWNNRPVVQIVNVNVYGRGYDPWRAWTVVPQRHFGGGYNVRRVMATEVDARTRGSFVARQTAPETRGYAVPRATAPIRVAGTASGRRSTSPVYTNLAPGASRVGPGSSRPMVRSSVGPSRSSAADSSRAEESSGSLARSRAVPRSDSASGIPARDINRDGPSRIGGLAAAQSPAPAAGGERTRGRVSPAPYGDARYGAPVRTEAPTAQPRDYRAYRQPPVSPDRRGEVTAPGSVAIRPPATSGVEAGPSYRREAPQRRAPDRAPEGERPSAGPRAVPRSAPPAGQPAPESRPGPGANRQAPASDRPAGDPAAGSRPRSGGQSSSGVAVGRPGGRR